MQKIEADIVVIGSGPAGQKAAIQAAKYGKKVIMVEKAKDPGGTCLYAGTIPSKSLREAIIDLTRFHERKFFDQKKSIGKVTFKNLQKRLNSVIEEQKGMLYRQLRRNHVKLITGVARFESPTVLLVVDGNEKVIFHIVADNYIIATGSKPRKPEGVPFDNKVIFDSTSLLQINKIPKSMIVLGGGVIGSEYSSFFSTLGTEVTVIDKKDHILPFLDSEIGIHLQTALTDIGVKFMGNKTLKTITREGKGAKVEFDDGTFISADTVLFTLGRCANVEGLNIEKAEITTNEKGCSLSMTSNGNSGDEILELVKNIFQKEAKN